VDELAAWLGAARDDHPVDQLRALAELARVHLEAVVLSSAIDDLLFSRVAPHGAGHPLLLAIACSEAGRRAGLPVGIVAGACVAHRGLAEPLLVDPARGSLCDAPCWSRRCRGSAATSRGAHPQPHRRARRARRPAVLGAAGRRAAPRAAHRASRPTCAASARG
jgi:hypothetical protein